MGLTIWGDGGPCAARSRAPRIQHSDRLPLAPRCRSRHCSRRAALPGCVWWLIPYCQSIGAGTALLVVYGIGAGITPTCLFVLAGRDPGRAGAPTASASCDGPQYRGLPGADPAGGGHQALRRLERGLAAVRQHDPGRDGRGRGARADAADEPKRAGGRRPDGGSGHQAITAGLGHQDLGSGRIAPRSSGAGDRHGSPAYGW